MADISEALASAIQQHRAGRLHAAEQAYRQILEIEPDHADALHLLGVLCSQAGDHRRAERLILRVLRDRPEWSEAQYNLGNALRGQRKFDEAVVRYRRALELKPDYAEAHVNLGNSLKDLGHLDGAVACYRRALDLNLDVDTVHVNLGHALQGQRKLDEAVACYRRALERNPNSAEACNNLGHVLTDQGKADEAVASCRRALELKPEFSEAHNNLGSALRQLGKLDESVACFRRAVKLSPDAALVHLNLGIVLKDLKQLDAAVACFRRALALQPDDSEAQNELGTALMEQGFTEEAVACFRQILDRKPGLAFVHSNLGEALKIQGKLDEAAACYRRALDLKPNLAAVHSNLLYALHYGTGITPAALAEAHAAFDRQLAAPLRGAVRAFENSRAPQRRLRVGFVSPDLGRHPVGYFLVRVLENLNPERLETICYSDRRGMDDLTRRLQAAAAQWRDTAATTNERLAGQIRSDRIDVLIDLAGHTGGNRLLVFARKPAPIQMTWIGYEGTTGLQSMDYLLADRYVVPAGSESDYREHVLRLPDGYLCYDPRATAPPPGPLPALKHGSVTFASFNNLAKMTPEVVAVWAQILRAVPPARLALKSRGLVDQTVQDRWFDLFARHGVEPRRLVLQPWGSYLEYMTAFQQVDVSLDPFPFSGSTVTCDSLWMGVPVITCPQATFASRHSLSHLSNVGLTETIARDLDHYVELAVALAADLPRLAGMRSGLRERMAASPLCDGKRFATNLETLLRDVWHNWIAVPQGASHDEVRPAHASRSTALAGFRQALEREPESALAHSNLGNVLKDLGQLDEAVACYHRALEFQPDLALVHNNLAVALTGQGQLAAAVAAYRRALALQPDLLQAHSNLLYTLNFCPGYDGRSIYEEHRQWERRHAKPLAKLTPSDSHDRATDRRLRVGYVSPDFCRHPVGLFILPLLAHHDSQRFEIFCYSSVKHSDEITERCRAHVAGWRDVGDLSDEQVALAIRQDQIDILVDLTMHMPGNRLLAFARKPAPIQVTYLAYCGTTGLETIDYRLTDPYLDPADRNERIYSETSIRLRETYWCYPERGESPSVGLLPSEETGHITFGCLNNFCKVTEPTREAWGRLLLAMPDSRLLLHAHAGSHRDRLREEFVRQGISADRISFTDYLPTEQYLCAYDRIDVALDPFPLGGGTTTCDALWMGVPVVSLAGDTAVGRSSLSILSNVGLADLVAPDVATYVQIALDLARDRTRLAALRCRLREQMRASPLMNAPRFAKNVEAAYRGMWQRWCATDEHQGGASRPFRGPHHCKVKIISATRLSERDFWNHSALGISLQRLPHDRRLVSRVAFANARGLPEVYNAEIAADESADILVFMHDDVWIDECFLVDRVIEGLKTFQVLGVAGNRRRVPRQPAWAFVDRAFTWDDELHLSGCVAHGASAFGRIDHFGAVPAACELLDGVFLAARKIVLQDHNVRFDPRFGFHFYDLDFCRSARQCGLRLGTWPIWLTHQSSGAFGMPLWNEGYRKYLEKWTD